MTSFFQRHPPPRSTLAKIFRAFRCWWRDGWYNAGMWDELLQQEFSPTRGMFDVQPVSGTKIAVTTTVGRPMLLVNYRRTSQIQSGKREQDLCGRRGLWLNKILEITTMLMKPRTRMRSLNCGNGS
jgi:hypothetical protein